PKGNISAINECSVICGPIGCAVDFVCRLLHLKIISLKKPLQIGLCNKAELSRKLPFVIGYFFVKSAPYYNAPRNADGKKLPFVRVTCYIFDGDFWIRDERISDTVSIEIKNNPDAYYEYIFEKVKTEYMIKVFK
ncbi:hypothetical protein XM61_03130, partial [Acinetobacter pittii]